ncbi:hypothetical protein IAE55_27010 [Paenibacillus sp. S28]|nr:hypothetical protein [Paenibacillus sp. S28]
MKSFQELTCYNDKHLVIGDMLELGDHEEEFHQIIGHLKIKWGWQMH